MEKWKVVYWIDETLNIQTQPEWFLICNQCRYCVVYLKTGGLCLMMQFNDILTRGTPDLKLSSLFRCFLKNCCSADISQPLKKQMLYWIKWAVYCLKQQQKQTGNLNHVCLIICRIWVWLHSSPFFLFNYRNHSKHSSMLDAVLHSKPQASQDQAGEQLSSFLPPFEVSQLFWRGSVGFFSQPNILTRLFF